MTAPREDSASGTLRLTSPALADGAPIAQVFTCDGKNQSPPLAWVGVPVSTRSFTLMAQLAPRRSRSSPITNLDCSS